VRRFRQKVEMPVFSGYCRLMTAERQKTESPARLWIKRLGIAGFLFFLIKGLLWLLVPALIAYFSFK
jgi:hypothetical protein